MTKRIWTLIAGGILLNACASTPQPQPVNGAVRIASTAPGYTSDPRVVAADRRAKEMGYHLEMRNHVEFYCRSIAPLGSRLPQKECLTHDGMVQAVEMSDENKAALKQFGPNCQGAKCVIT